MSDANGLPTLGLGLVNLSPVIALLLFTVRRCGYTQDVQGRLRGNS